MKSSTTMKTKILIAAIMLAACSSSSSAPDAAPDAEETKSAACPDQPWLGVYGSPLPSRCDEACAEEPLRSRSCFVALDGGIVATCNTTVFYGQICCRRDGDRVRSLPCLPPSAR